MAVEIAIIKDGCKIWVTLDNQFTDKTKAKGSTVKL